MSRKLIAILVSSTLVWWNAHTSAWSANIASSTVRTHAVQTVGTANNASPLPPGAAAGIKEAQGSERVLLGLGLAAAFLAIAWLVLDDDTTSTGTSTGT
jgi:hypothetical protein